MSWKDIEKKESMENETWRQWFPLCLQMQAEVTEPWKARSVTREAFPIKASQRNTLLTSQFGSYRPNFVINSYCSIPPQVIYASYRQCRNYRIPRIEIKMNKIVLQIKIELTKFPLTNTAVKGWNIFYQTWGNIAKWLSLNQHKIIITMK